MSRSKKHHHSHSRSSSQHRSEAKRVLREAVEQDPIGLTGLHAAQFQLINLFARVQKMHDYIDEAFAGEPFLPGTSPNAPANIQRFNVYVEEHTRVARLLERTIQLWLLACGMKKEDNWVPLLIENIRQTAAARSIWASARHKNQNTGQPTFAKQTH